MTTNFNIPLNNEILDVFWESMTEGLGIEFIIEDQAGARPPASGVPEDKNYGTLKLLTGPVQEGDDAEVFIEDGDDLLVETVGQREMTLSVNIYRAGAGSLMSKLNKLFNSRNFRQRLYMLAMTKYGKDLKIIDALSSQDLSALVQSDYEERFQMDVRIRTISSMTESVDPIEEVTVDGTVVNEAGETVDEGKTTIKLP